MNQSPLVPYGTPTQLLARALQLCDRLEVSADSREDLETLYGVLENLERHYAADHPGDASSAAAAAPPA